jgi:hypothetical protein
MLRTLGNRTVSLAFRRAHHEVTRRYYDHLGTCLAGLPAHQSIAKALSRAGSHGERRIGPRLGLGHGFGAHALLVRLALGFGLGRHSRLLFLLCPNSR